MLSEYLDGRLRGAAQERVARELGSCAACRENLESLRATVSLLQSLPVTPLRRSFTMAAPPPEPVAARPPTPLRMPSWVYAGAASLAGLALAVLISTDATGILAPDGRVASVAPSDIAAPTPDLQAAPLPQEEEARSMAAVPEGEAGGEQQDLIAPAVEAEGALTERAAPTTETAPSDEAVSTETTALTGDPPADISQESDQAPVAGSEGTAVVWRVLEGVAAALALAFLLGLVLKSRASRRTKGAQS